MKQLRGAGQAFISEQGEWIATDDTGQVVAIDLRAARGRRLDPRPEQPPKKKVGWGPRLSCETRCRLDGAPPGGPTWLRADWVSYAEGEGSLSVDGAWLLLHYDKLGRENEAQGLNLSLVAPEGAVRWTFGAFPPDVRHLKAAYLAQGRLLVVVHTHGDEGLVLALDPVSGKESWRQPL